MACLRQTHGGRCGRPLTHSSYTIYWDTTPAAEWVKTTSLNEGLEQSGHTRNVSFPIGGEPVMQQAAGCLGSSNMS